MSLLEVSGLSKSYASRRRLRRDTFVTRAVDDVSFSVDHGQTVALVGESGAGKSTVGSLVLRLIEADAGQILLDGMDVRTLSTSELRRTRRHMQMVFQDPYGCLDPRMSIGRSVAEPLQVLTGMNRSDRERKAAEMLARVSLDPRIVERYPHELSGGQLQRVSIARVLTLAPSLIVCDEAVSALDVSVRAQILALLADLQEEFQLSYLFIAHDLSVVEAIADYVIVMASGKVMEQGPSTDVFSNPQSGYTKELLSAVPSPNPRDRHLLRGRQFHGQPGDELAVANGVAPR